MASAPRFPAGQSQVSGAHGRSAAHADQASRHTKTHECTEPAPHSLPTGRRHDRKGCGTGPSTPPELRAAVAHNFFEVPFHSKREPLIFVGNQEDIRRRAAFTVLGLYYPERVDAVRGPTLF